MNLFYDRQGKAIDAKTFGRFAGDPDYKILAQHWVRGWMVSTVWLGIDHNFTGRGSPIIFETMIFPPGDETRDGESIWANRYMDRYATEVAAHAGHDQALTWLRSKLGEDALADILGPLVEGSSDSEWDGTI